jgi:hypothetical protein
MKQGKSCQEGVKRAHPVPRILDLSQCSDRESASLLLDTPGAYGTRETLVGTLAVVWLPAGGALKSLDQQRLAEDDSRARA